MLRGQQVQLRGRRAQCPLSLSPHGTSQRSALSPGLGELRSCSGGRVCWDDQRTEAGLRPRPRPRPLRGERWLASCPLTKANNRSNVGSPRDQSPCLGCSRRSGPFACCEGPRFQGSSAGRRLFLPRLLVTRPPGEHVMSSTVSPARLQPVPAFPTSPSSTVKTTPHVLYFISIVQH